MVLCEALIKGNVRSFAMSVWCCQGSFAARLRTSLGGCKWGCPWCPAGDSCLAVGRLTRKRGPGFTIGSKPEIQFLNAGSRPRKKSAVASCSNRARSGSACDVGQGMSWNLKLGFILSERTMDNLLGAGEAVTSVKVLPTWLHLLTAPTDGNTR